MLGLRSVAQNSLRAPCGALRSDNCAKSDDEGAARLLRSPALLARAYGTRLGSLRIAASRSLKRTASLLKHEAQRAAVGMGPVRGVEERRAWTRREALRELTSRSC
jgi:hypothetical protein